MCGFCLSGIQIKMLQYFQRKISFFPSYIQITLLYVLGIFKFCFLFVFFCSEQEHKLSIKKREVMQGQRFLITMSTDTQLEIYLPKKKISIYRTASISNIRLVLWLHSILKFLSFLPATQQEKLLPFIMGCSVKSGFCLHHFISKDLLGQSDASSWNSPITSKNCLRL